MTVAGDAATVPDAAVLVLDDEPDVRDLLRLVLERRGRRVLTAADGREGLRLLCAEPVAVALIDMMMPGMNGRQFLAEVGRLPPAQRPHVFVISAMRPESVALELAGLSGFEVVGKPFDLDEIQQRVAAAVAARGGAPA
jgi:CheY-like chemotaxis protein